MTPRGLGGLGAAALLVACQPSVADRTEDRAQIHRLLVDYGRTLDARDFDGFAALFADDGVYVAGGGGQPLSGKAAGEAMRRVFAENASGFGDPNYHLFFNEVVDFTGPDSATATSQSLYMVPAESGQPRAAMMAQYDDELVRREGQWKFARRTVRGLMPAPPPR
ncbi:MAG TPA: nuclear transport factor 2 family protein [Croceibacterium sp.]|nr:nuclear transport factor 2 family protein [Croceibacterium sp.]